MPPQWPTAGACAPPGLGRSRPTSSAIAGHRNLSIAAVARRQQISPGYIRKLFMAEGTTFSAFLLDKRLARAHRMLRDPRFAGRTISAIAFDAGFGDLSYFNRAFRRRYGAAPSDVRARARGANGS